MTNGPGAERVLEQRVTRLENDVESIYEILNDIQSTQTEHTARFDGMDARLDGMDARFEAIDARFEAIDGRFDGVDGRLEGIDATLAEILRRLPTV